MKSGITKVKSSEEIELDELLTKFRLLENLLADKELKLSTLNYELSIFEIRYLKIVGKRITELDTLVAQLLRILASRNPKNKEYQQSANKAQQRAYESSQASEHAAEKEDIPDRFEPTDDIKKLYREVAKRIHPDLAPNEEERSYREELMKEANEAYSTGDIQKLEEILSSIKDSVSYLVAISIEKQIEKIKMKISEVQARIDAIENEINYLLGSDLCQLKMRVEEAEKQGIDLLGKMASQVVSRIKRIENQLYTIIQEHYEWGGIDV